MFLIRWDPWFINNLLEMPKVSAKSYLARLAVQVSMVGILFWANPFRKGLNLCSETKGTTLMLLKICSKACKSTTSRTGNIGFSQGLWMFMKNELFSISSVHDLRSPQGYRCHFQISVIILAYLAIFGEHFTVAIQFAKVWTVTNRYISVALYISQNTGNSFLLFCFAPV